MQMEILAIEHLTSSFNGAATFAYSLADHHGPEVSDPLKEFADQVVSDILAYLKNRGRNTGIDDATVEKQLAVIATSLQTKNEHLIDDFAHGIMANEKMKKDPLVSLIANQTNSPGAVQQLGVGNFSQTALVQNYPSLVETIDRVIASDEFAALKEDQKAQFQDYAGSLKDEASNAKPEAGRLQRWGTRLLNFCREAGMKVATSSIADVLTKIFIG